MATLITDTTLSDKLIDARRASGADRWDEVWEDIYMMTPMPNDEHQDIVGAFTAVFREVVQIPGKGLVRPGVNITDREDDWTANYRCPDVVVFLHRNNAECRDTHWLGGPDFLVEVLSPEDRTREKLEFYANVKTREVFIVDRDPWALELWRLDGEELKLAGSATVDNGKSLASDVLSLEFRLIAGDDRPAIEVTEAGGERTWQV